MTHNSKVPLTCLDKFMYTCHNKVPRDIIAVTLKIYFLPHHGYILGLPHYSATQAWHLDILCISRVGILCLAHYKSAFLAALHLRTKV